MDAAAESAASLRIERAVRRARLNLLWEAVWPVVAAVIALAALFTALSWLDVWRALPTPLRLLAVAAFAAAVAARIAALGRIRLPTRAAAFARVELATGATHHPATAFRDRLATDARDPASRALWSAHRLRLLGALQRVRAGAPMPRLAEHDPYALRYLIALIFVVGFFVAGEQRPDRLADAFRGGALAAAAPARIDAWVTPPAYTGRPPIFLSGEAVKPDGDTYSVPAGSIVTVRGTASSDLAVVARTAAGSAPVPSATPASSVAPGGAGPTPTAPDSSAAPTAEHRLALTTTTDVTVAKGGHDLATWHFTVVADKPPSIALAGDPTTTVSGALHLTYSVEDDYGVATAFGEIRPAGPPSAAAARPLYGPPPLVLALPQAHTRSGTGETIRDLTAHPWAGAAVKLTLVARDDAGQEGRSTPVEVNLPVRQFNNPLARAVVEQRARLAQDANAAPIVSDGLDALTMAPATGVSDFGAYLLLRSAYYRLTGARNDDDLRGVVDYLWQIALGLEDGDRALAAEQLRAAEDALQQALQNNASSEEIAKLTEQLRQALQTFMQSMAEQAMRNPNAGKGPPDANAQILRPEDLAKMLDNIEDLAKTGARDAARQLLSQLQNMMENLRSGNPGQADPATQQAMQQLNQLGDMIRKQQALMNQTFGAERGQDGHGKPLDEQQLKQALKDLQAGQQALGDALGKLLQQLEGAGTQPNGKLGQAGEAMGRAAQALGQGEPGGAVGEQSDALDALRQGAQNLAQQLASGQAEGSGDGMGTPGGQSDSDPLGRPMRNAGSDLGSSVKVPGAIDTQRARKIFDAIRQRLGQPSLPAFERDYLERLLDQF
jgi:uncharacterized protein (TIGR02302 family)